MSDALYALCWRFTDIAKKVNKFTNHLFLSLLQQQGS